jgi:parvulin-like peptidyl-prolyl isomerase
MWHRLLITLLITLLSSGLQAQRPLPAIEQQLDSLAQDILYHESLEHKLAQNKRFASLLVKTLERPDSYRYGFDSLETISILRAEDNAFRIFTWQIVDIKNPGTRYGEQVHYYFGLIQRKYQTKADKTDYVVIPLIEMQEIPPGVENMVLDNTQWLGGLYYPPKYNDDELVKHTFKYYAPKDKGPQSYQDAFQAIQESYDQLSDRDQRRLEHMDRKQRNQMSQQEASERNQTRKLKKVKRDMYVLLGWNGLDNRSNLKFVDVLSFDPRDSSRAIFGANVFFFDPLVAKHRAMFRYSEYSPFSLNYAYVQHGLFPWSKKRMIVYDHLAMPGNSDRKLKEIWEMGPDGSYDALYFRKSRFNWLTNIELAEDYNNKVTRKALEEQQARERERLKKAGINLSSGENDQPEPREKK